LQDALQARRVVMLTGPRQCGKTTLVRQLISKNVEYKTLDDAVFRKAAEEDPHLFVEGVPENSTMMDHTEFMVRAREAYSFKTSSPF
jgi:predicted AAA+ superfamily ATPase